MADRIYDLVPVSVVKRVDSFVLELHDSLTDSVSDGIRKVWVKAGSQLNHSVKALAEEIGVIVGKCIVHLSCALRVPNVMDFVLASGMFDGFDLGRLVIYTHVRPFKTPVFRILRRVSHVSLTVLGTSVVTKPHIVALINKLQVERLVRFLIVREPTSSVLEEAMLDDHGSKCIERFNWLTVNLTSNVKGC